MSASNHPTQGSSDHGGADLVCGLCRKRTTETVTKLCHSCGLPVHLSCAQHVAARDCDLEVGFSLPSVFCSKRCYESDFLGNHGDDGANGMTTPRWSPDMPNEVTAALTLKIGDVSRTSRKHLSITSFRFLLTEGFEVFKAKVNSRTIKELQAYTGEPHVREDVAIYIRPGVHSKQAELVELAENNFETRIRKTYRNYLKRKSTQSNAAIGGGARQEQFVCDIYTYVKKASVVQRQIRSRADALHNGPGSSRSRKSRNGGSKSGLSAQPTTDQQQYVYVPQQRGRYDDFAVGNNSTALIVENHLSNADSNPSASDSSVIGNKRRLSEAQQQGFNTGSNEPTTGYKSIRMVLNGSVVAVKVNVSDLLAALGLPSPGDPVVPTASLNEENVL